MLVVGEYKGQGTYLFAVSVSQLTSRWNVMAYEPIDGSEGQTLVVDELLTANQARFQAYTIASAICTGKGKVTKYYGDLGIVSQLISKFDQFEVTPYLFNGEEFQADTYTMALESMRILPIMYGYSNVRPMKDLAYIPVKQRTAKPLESLLMSMKRGDIKSYDEIMREYDTSWMRDASGKNIKDYSIVNTPEQFGQLMATLKRENPEVMSIDTETTGTEIYEYPGAVERRDEIAGMSLSWRKDQGIYIPFLSTRMETLDYHEVMEDLQPFLNSRKVLVAHNAPFDYRVFYSYGTVINITDDTQVMAFLLDSRVSKGSKGLKLLTRQYFGHETLELDDILGKGFTAKLVPEIDPDLIRIYACADTDYTLQLYWIQLQQIKKLQRLSYQLDRKLTPMLAVADYYGVNIDEQLLSTLSSINMADIEKVEQLATTYYYEIGMRLQATKFLKYKYGEDVTFTNSEISEIAEDPDFRTTCEPLFQKQTKKGGPLQLTSSSDVVYIMYTLLEYKITRISPDSGKPQADAEALDDLMYYKASEPAPFLKEDLRSSIVNSSIRVHADETVLISKARLESYMYPFAYLLSVHRSLTKLQNSFFDKLLSESVCHRYYTRNSQTSAETGRVINPVQTLIGALKKLVIPYSKDHYMIVFDKSQIEYRVMIGLANEYWKAVMAKVPDNEKEQLMAKALDRLVDRLDSAEADYHREGGAIFIDTTPEDMTKQERDSVKSIHFSVPFGAGAYSISKGELRTADDVQEEADIVHNTQSKLAAWSNHLFPLQHYLNYCRTRSEIPVSDDMLPELLKGGQYGMVKNPTGRVRYFDLSDKSFKAISRIRRQVGNFPIQSFAREIFFKELYSLRNALIRDGLIKDYVDKTTALMHVFVHDESTLQIPKTHHPFRMYRYLLDHCVTHLKGHPTYFMGTSVVNNWYDGKEDKYEATYDFVKTMAEEYEKNPNKFESEAWTEDVSQYVYNYICKYMTDRFMQEIERIQKMAPDYYTIEPTFFMSHFKNYFLKSRVALYNQPLRKAEYTTDPMLKNKYDNIIFQHITQFIKEARPDEYAKFRLIFNGVSVALQDLEDSSDDMWELGTFDVTTASFDDLLSDSMSDNADREEQISAEFALLTDQGYSVPANFGGSERRLVVAEKTDGTGNSKRLWFTDWNNRIVIDVSNLNQNGFSELVAYLKKFVHEDGSPLCFAQGANVTDSNAKVIPNFDDEIIYNIFVGNPRSNVNQTKHFE